MRIYFKVLSFKVPHWIPKLIYISEYLKRGSSIPNMGMV